MNSNETALSLPTKTSDKQLLNGKYSLDKVITTNDKGYVMTARMLAGHSWKKCVIKQGKKNAGIDPAGRDIKERLNWQQTVYQEIHQDILLPEVYEYFEVDGDGYLATAFIDGQSLYDLVLRTFRSAHWSTLTGDEQSALLNYMEQIMAVVSRFHEKGYVHRDITATNFIVDSKNVVWPIDLELVYNMKKDLPNPAFASGTRGYVAPEQLDMERPNEKADIYSVGALMMFMFTGMEPAYLIEGNRENLKRRLQFLIGDASIVSIILSCIDDTTRNRPDILQIMELVGRRKSVFTETKANFSPLHGSTLKDSVHSILQKGIDTLGWEYLLHDGLWASEAGERKICMGMSEGICGVIYFLSRARKAGYDIAVTRDVLRQALDEIFNKALPHMAAAPSGLSNGSAGLAVAVANAIGNGLVPMTLVVPDAMKNSLIRDLGDLDVVGGKAGHGLAVLQCEHYIGKEQAEEYLRALTASLSDLQQDDGAWITGRDTYGAIEKDHSFGYGAAGILYYLLEYYQRYEDTAALRIIERGLSYLEGISIKQDGKRQWSRSNVNKQVYTSWFLGTAGIALTFIKAYTCLRTAKWRTIAEAALRSIPEKIIHRNTGQCYGISGVGEIMLQADTAFDTGEWRERCDWIAAYLLHMAIEPNKTLNYWRSDNPEHFTADLMVGSSGVLHFLLRYNCPSKYGLPLVG